MTRVILVARIVLGLLFFAFGLIGVLNLVKAQLPAGDAGVFVAVLMTHGYMKFVSLLEVIAGLLLLVGVLSLVARLLTRQRFGAQR